MKRLRDLEGGPLIERAAALLRTVDPCPETPERMDRIRRAIAARAPLTAKRRGRSAIWIGAGCLVAAGAAAATAGLQAPAPVASSGMRAGGTSIGTQRESVPSEDPVAVSPETRTPSSLRERPSGDVRGERAAPSRSSAWVSMKTRKPAPDGSARAAAEAALVQSAVKALRRDGDPDKATELLERYSDSDPNGPLAEEALALRIEAATSKKQDSAARTWAREYLSRYPQGRYRKAAERALASP